MYTTLVVGTSPSLPSSHLSTSTTRPYTRVGSEPTAVPLETSTLPECPTDVNPVLPKISRCSGSTTYVERVPSLVPKPVPPRENDSLDGRVCLRPPYSGGKGFLLDFWSLVTLMSICLDPFTLESKVVVRRIKIFLSLSFQTDK